MKEIDEGTDLTEIEIIQNPREGIDRAWGYVQKSKYEILSIFATPNTFRRQVNMGLLQLLKEATEQRHVQVRILIPGDKQIKDTIDQAAKVYPLVDFRVAEENMQTRITIVLIDKKDCMIVELFDHMNDELFGWAQFFSSISTAAALFVLSLQTYFIKKQVLQTQEQMDAKLRPWVGNVDYKSPSVRNEHYISVYLTNVGDIVASSCLTRNTITANKITKEDIIIRICGCIIIFF